MAPRRAVVPRARGVRRLDRPAIGLAAAAGRGRERHWGPAVSRSDDLGATWQPDEPAIRFSADADAAVERVWQLQPGHEDEPEALYAGVSPAALFRSGDGGESFGLVRGLWDHPHRPQVAARRRRALPAHDR